MQDKITIYLAGKMSGLTFEEMNNWRVDIKKKFIKYPQVKVINPVDYYNFDKYEEMKATPREVKDYDLYLVENSNIILVNLDYPDSIGTAIELHMGQYWRIPIIGFGKTKNHDWIECCLSRRCNDVNEAIEYIEEFYLSLL